MKIFNTLTRKKEEFTPIEEGKVGIYCCGPTVYNFAHIGNLRSFLFEDILKRTFKLDGFEVKHVMNITDVGHLTSDADEGEDKMAKGAKRENKTVWEVAQFYTDAFFEDIKRLNIITPDITPKATEHINEMIELIQTLEKKGHTYVSDGNVYFDTSTWETYGELAKLKLDDLKAGARVDVDEGKRNHTDFVLWFTKSKYKNHAMQWDSPWGRGFPGWHIECSAMSIKHLGETFDIHCGGIDHVPVHHTNEIAQSEGATGKRWVNYWMHNEFLNIQDAKMAKSGENFITLQTLIDKGYDPLDFRYFILGSQYRTQVTFSYEALDGARNARNNLNEKILEFKESTVSDEPEAKVKRDEFSSTFIEALNDDLNTPKAMAVVWAVVKDEDVSDKTKDDLLLMFDKVLGLDLDKLEREDIPDEINDLVAQRQAARDSKNFAEADRLRGAIQEKGYILDDTKDGTKVKKKI